MGYLYGLPPGLQNQFFTTFRETKNFLNTFDSQTGYGTGSFRGPQPGVLSAQDAYAQQAQYMQSYMMMIFMVTLISKITGKDIDLGGILEAGGVNESIPQASNLVKSKLSDLLDKRSSETDSDSDGYAFDSQDFDDIKDDLDDERYTLTDLKNGILNGILNGEGAKVDEYLSLIPGLKEKGVDIDVDMLLDEDFLRGLTNQRQEQVNTFLLEQPILNGSNRLTAEYRDYFQDTLYSNNSFMRSSAREVLTELSKKYLNNSTYPNESAAIQTLLNAQGVTVNSDGSLNFTYEIED